MAASLTLPAGYRIERSRDGYALHSDHFGEIGEGDYGCWASACDAAHDHADEMADEADPVEAKQALVAYHEALDSFHEAATRSAAASSDDAKTRGRRRAARTILAAIDGIAAPAGRLLRVA